MSTRTLLFVWYRSAPRDGAYVHGMYMEGARWDIQQGVILDSRLKELFPHMPVINIRVRFTTPEPVRSDHTHIRGNQTLSLCKVDVTLQITLAYHYRWGSGWWP